jgi:TetR/AcrR family tetracycline transcriptional repressor
VTVSRDKQPNDERFRDEAAARKGPPPRFTRAEITEAALDLLDAEGLAGLNLRRLAHALGLTPTAIYRYFDSKEALTAAMLAQAVEPFRTSAPAEGPWRERLASTLRALHADLLRHPGVLELINVRADPDRELDWARERIVGILDDAGFNETESIHALTAVISHVIGSITLETYRRRDHPETETERLRRLPRDEFPHLVRLSGEYVQRGSSAAFEYGLHRMIRGLGEPRRPTA